VLLHPNGFCGGLFEPVAVRVADRFRCLAVDLRGHGASDAPRDKMGFAFATLAADVVAVLDHLAITSCVLLGESLGGGVGVLVDELAPGRIRALMLCEAIVFDAHPTPSGPIERADLSRRRRTVFPDRPTMVRAYAGRPPLAEMASEALEAYARWGTVDLPVGSVRLACDPEVEATVFEFSADARGAADAWDHLADVHATVSVLGGDSSFLPLELFERQAERAGVPLTVVPGGHFFLQADSERAAAMVRAHLG
jgi:pimeloyl-ACP methyl ester carboxylesterase